jgi:sulfide:quinone oxidoreductase
MASFKITGGTALKGEVHPQGAKNEVLQIICAVLLTDEQVRAFAPDVVLVSWCGVPPHKLQPERVLRRVDAGRRVASLDDGQELTYDLLLGVPTIRAPRLLEESGLVSEGFVPVNPKTLETPFPGVYSVGDCARQGTPKAGVFAEGAARVVAAGLIARLRGETSDAVHRGTGSCYIEFGADRIGRVDIDFFSNPAGPVGIFHEPSVALRRDKEEFGSSRRARWT